MSFVEFFFVFFGLLIIGAHVFKKVPLQEHVWVS